MIEHRVNVVLHLPALGRTLGQTQLRVQVEDVSELDAPAKVVSRLVLDVPSLDLSSASTLLFELPYTGAPPDLTVSAVLAADTSRPPSPGDLVTTVAVPVVSGEPAHIHLVEYDGV